MSVLLRPPIPASRAPQARLVAAVTVAEAPEEGHGITAGIRWPNDVLVEDGKVCGILAEGSSAPNGRLAHVILGIGINVNLAWRPRAVTLGRHVRTPDGRDGVAEDLDAEGGSGSGSVTGR